jgi:molecular chaperone GrpE (heat shock protein)
MTRPLTEKEQLISKLTGIYDQLEELDLALEASFSDLRMNLEREQQEKIADCNQKMIHLENIIDSISMGAEKINVRAVNLPYRKTIPV